MSLLRSGVHLVEIAGEQVGLLAAFGAADLDDHVAAGVRVRGDHQLAEFGLQRCQLGGDVVEFVDEDLAFVAGRAVEELSGGVAVAAASVVPADLLDDGAEVVVPLRHRAQLVGVGEDLGIGELVFERLVLVHDLGEPVGHRHVRPRRVRPAARAVRQGRG